MRIACLDPGIACTAVAVFDVPSDSPRLAVNAAQRAHWLARTESFRTSSKDPLCDRLLQLSEAVAHCAVQDAWAAAIVEVPAFAGLYRERRGRARTSGADISAASMSSFWQALGAVLVGLRRVSIPLVTQHAIGSKDQKRTIVNANLRRAGKPIPSSQHIADAVFVGLTTPWPDLTRKGAA